ncbi:MAG TPA: DUF465 domain-containing protein, partial [Parvularculaceae bacterium]|nr:DUF465 domain-containing protein [Parvularculaceae bacterium]
DEHPKSVIDASHFFSAHESGFKGANEDALQTRLNLLLQEHSDLDAAIVALATTPGHDSLALARLKKKKLQLKDLIQKLRDQLTPDIIA